MDVFFDKSCKIVDVEATVLLLNNSPDLMGFAAEFDRQYDNTITNFLMRSSKFRDKFGTIDRVTLNADGKIRYIILVSIGEVGKLDMAKFREVGGIVSGYLSSLKISNAQIVVDIENHDLGCAKISSYIASGAKLASYRFDKYQTKKQKEESPRAITKVTVGLTDYTQAATFYEAELHLINAIFLARDCISEPANVLYPDTYAEIIVDKLEACGVTVDVIGEREMKNLGMGALLGVGQGSIHESKLVVMKYYGADDRDSPPVAFVGKGVTFDTGGISIKPALNMGDMKYDMAGSASVMGAVMALALRNAKVNVVGVVGLVENMPGGNAQRPGDVVTTMSGQTVEVGNTDAEGRLVLCDALWYVQEKFHPTCIVDLATLTGAIVVALGSSYAGCFTNSDDLASKLIAAGAKVDENLWRMPLHKDYDKMIESDIADMSNMGNLGGSAGGAVGAQFLQRFIKEGVEWAHLDIAGMAWNKKSQPICPKGARGFGVMLLNQFVKDYYEAD